MPESLQDQMARLLTEAAASAEANQLADAAAEASAALDAWREAGQPDDEETTRG